MRRPGATSIREEDGRIVAAAWFEDAPGTARLTTDAQHAGLFETVLNYAEEWLCSVGADGKKKLDIELPLPQDKARKEVLLSRGYRPDGAENWNLYDLTSPFRNHTFQMVLCSSVLRKSRRATLRRSTPPSSRGFIMKAKPARRAC